MGSSTTAPTLDLTKQLDLRKQMVIDLKKDKGLSDQKAEVVLCLDYSGSMHDLYRHGEVQKLVERLLPIGMAFDDNQEVDFYLFHDGVIKLPKNLTPSNIAGYIDSRVRGKYDMGGTQYAPIINAIVDQFADQIGVRNEEVKVEKKGFLGMGKKTVTEKVEVPVYEKKEYPTYVIFITDGDCSDHEEAEKAIVRASRVGIFFQFVGIGRTAFPFLERLDTMDGRFIDNANFFSVSDLSKKTDKELYDLLLTEFPSYVRDARTKALIK